MESLLDFIKKKHEGQKRKYTEEPYWEHCVAVSEKLKEYGLNHLVEIALCHDLIKDTDCTPLELYDELKLIGYSEQEAVFISRGVAALTDVFTKENFPDMNREERKKLEAQRLSAIHPAYQTVKYADLIDNTKSITEHDPKFAKVYLQEKEYILSIMNEGHTELLKEANKHLVLIK